MSAQPLNSLTGHGATTPAWRMHIAVGQMAYEKGLYSAAVTNYNSALFAAEDLDLPDKDMSVALVGLAKCYCELGNFTEAESLYKRVLAIDQVTLTAKSAGLATDINDLASLYLKTKRLGEAEALLQKSVAILTAVDPLSVDLAAAEKNLSSVYCQLGRLDEAERLINHALTVCDTKAGRQTRVFAEVLIGLAVVAAKKGNNAEAEVLIERAISSFEVLTGGQHPELADFLDFAADLFRLEGVDSKVIELTSRAKAIRNHVRAMDH
jgi:tetratricopeptide (TPR) repeat protein